MKKYRIVGGNPLEGIIEVSGAKNAVLPILAACLLTDESCWVERVPCLTDVFSMMEVLRALGKEVSLADGRLEVKGGAARSFEVSDSLMRKFRASSLVLGPLLSRFHHFRAAFPGGCAIGARPIDLHIKGFRAMGARITEHHGYLEARVESRLAGADIHLDYPSVGATENIMMAAVLAEGQTIIRNAAREPEIVDLQNFLNSMGAHIIGAGLDCIRIDGVKSLRGVSHGVIPDRIEAGTHLVAVAIAGGEVLVNQIIAEHIEPAVAKLREAGMEFEPAGSGMLVRCRRPLRPINIKTMPYPGFPTDLQPQFMALMSVTEGTSVIIESIFENRFKHVPELRRMGGDISVEGRVSVVKGVEKLSGTVVEATDLRAGAALVLAGLAAEGVTEIEGIEHIDRGYEGMEDKYRAIGADIRRIG